MQLYGEPDRCYSRVTSSLNNRAIRTVGGARLRQDDAVTGLHVQGVATVLFLDTFVPQNRYHFHHFKGGVSGRGGRNPVRGLRRLWQGVLRGSGDGQGGQGCENNLRKVGQLVLQTIRSAVTLYDNAA